MSLNSQTNYKETNLATFLLLFFRWYFCFDW